MRQMRRLRAPEEQELLQVTGQLEVEPGRPGTRTATPHLGPFHSTQPGHSQATARAQREKNMEGRWVTTWRLGVSSEGSHSAQDEEKSG